MDNFVESDSSDLSSLSDCSDDDASNYIPSSLECTPHSQEKGMSFPIIFPIVINFWNVHLL